MHRGWAGETTTLLSILRGGSLWFETQLSVTTSGVQSSSSATC
jgi:hypothetical protein